MTDANKRNQISKGTRSIDAGSREFDKIDTARLSSGSMIKVDYERYAHFLENSDASEDDKREFVQLIWNIVFSIASLGFSVHPVQAAQKICGKNAFSAAARRKTPRQMLD